MREQLDVEPNVTIRPQLRVPFRDNWIILYFGQGNRVYSPLKGEEITLTDQQYLDLHILMSTPQNPWRPDKIVTARCLFTNRYHSPGEADRIRDNINSLRQAMGDTAFLDPKTGTTQYNLIHTVTTNAGYGYAFTFLDPAALPKIYP